MAKRYKEVFDPNHSQTCICHRGPMNRGLEESPVGDFVDIEDYEELKNQLAKANERVEELEAQQQLLVNEIEPLLDMQDGGEYYTRNSLADDIYEKFIGGSSAEALNKFAIAKKVEALDEVESVYMQAAETSDPISFREAFDSVEEQLRKEQDHEKTKS